ncbi:hypothetical protein MLD38_002509 [Melastoma candidum]|uniref:Uncharacterized protein n=1 Tax=Melastoma candidum TaxID=119954 RepID=A0ACB9S139_9MYRT|nr:hypothetical protein MLD38_002509 [Melastoma candidum]
MKFKVHVGGHARNREPHVPLCRRRIRCSPAVLDTGILGEGEYLVQEAGRDGSAEVVGTVKVENRHDDGDEDVDDQQDEDEDGEDDNDQEGYAVHFSDASASHGGLEDRRTFVGSGCVLIHVKEVVFMATIRALNKQA